MKNKQKKLLAVICASILALNLGGCGAPPASKDNLKLSQDGYSYTLENDAIRIVFNKDGGSIRELYNKKSDLYFVRGSEDGLAATVKKGAATVQPEELLSHKVLARSAEEISLEFVWDFGGGTKVTGTAALLSGADGAEFTCRVSGAKGSVSAVQYPIIDNITYLSGDGENDRLVSSFATGYLFKNPVKNFNAVGEDLTGQSAVTPSGFGSTMQFMGYYTENVGGFYIQTKDYGNTVKDFTVERRMGGLRAEIGHYVTDMDKQTTVFSYKTFVGNLIEGNWYEAAEKYKKWAVQSPWVKEYGLNKNRTDLNKELYENSVLVNFIAPSKPEHAGYAAALYNKIRDNIKTPQSKIFTVPFYYSIDQEISPDSGADVVLRGDPAFYKLLEKNGEPIAQFEYTDLQKENALNGGGRYEWLAKERVKNSNGGFSDIMFSEKWNYICNANERFRTLVTARQSKQFSSLKMQGIYNDLGICAVHPVNCFDTAHGHGGEVNILDDAIELLRRSRDISRSYTVDSHKNLGFTGQEMIIENAIPYVDFYQARANGGSMSGMEHDRIMKLVERDYAVKIPLFEYVYHEYSGVRGDGFTLPVASVGTPYYYATAFTALNGGIPEFNYECYRHDKFADLVEDFDVRMIQFIDTLGKARLTYGKEFLVYGKMARSPDIGIDREFFDYSTPIVIDWASVGGNKEGRMALDPVVVTSFEAEGKTAVFMCNVTDTQKTVDFMLDAKKLYGIESSGVTLYKDGISMGALESISGGKAQITFLADSRAVYMLTIG